MVETVGQCCLSKWKELESERTRQKNHGNGIEEERSKVQQRKRLQTHLRYSPATSGRRPCKKTVHLVVTPMVQWSSFRYSNDQNATTVYT